MINRVRICGLLLATLTASRLPAINYCCTIQASFFHASGPVAVGINHSANVCVTNLGNNTARVLLAFVNAQTTTPNQANVASPQILAVREAALAPGAGVCLGMSGQALKNAVDPNNQNNTWDGNTIAIVVPGGHIQGGIIVQGESVSHSGGVNVDWGLVPSLQIIDGNLIGGTTVLTPNMTLRSGDVNGHPGGVN